jgi:catechol 2,3-dioxygenase-like lactoylglutathione lyase family enzyme
MAQYDVERIEPVLRVENMQASLRFYVDVLGFQNADWGSDDFTGLARGGGSLYLCHGDQGRGGAWVWIGVDDVRPLYDELKARGVPILLPPTNFPWALEMRVADPDGNILRFGSEPE